MDIFRDANLFKFVTGDALVGHPAKLVIKAVEMEKVSGPLGEAEKAVMYFEKSRKPLILNQSHAKELYKALGRETRAWVGATVELYSEVGKLKGQPYNAVKIRVVEKPAQLTTAQHKERRAKNADMLRGQDEGPIGEEAPTIQPVDLFAPAPEAQPVEELDF